jgi:hypothetical protein
MPRLEKVEGVSDVDVKLSKKKVQPRNLSVALAPEVNLSFAAPTSFHT